MSHTPVPAPGGPASPQRRRPGGGPPPPGRRQQLRARWADRHALPRFGFWLLSRGAVVLAVCGALYVLNGFLIGWANAYNVLTGITSPADVRPHGRATDVQWQNPLTS
ncbi:hypothetical protein [Streptomyces sp. NBC_00057]|uniref:hypothetical protein n=1 Tax=Streptomyces sp. NBC_00057 TaxID=2975634 RepID=UPI002F90BAD8